VVSILIFIYIQFSQLDSNNKTDQNSCWGKREIVKGRSLN
jgi:hypothetical protein